MKTFQAKSRTGQRAIVQVVENQNGVRVLLVDGGLRNDWQVQGPDRFGQKLSWAQPDEATARRFAARLRAVLKQEKEK